MQSLYICSLRYTYCFFLQTEGSFFRLADRLWEILVRMKNLDENACVGISRQRWAFPEFKKNAFDLSIPDANTATLLILDQPEIKLSILAHSLWFHENICFESIRHIECSTIDGPSTAITKLGLVVSGRRVARILAQVARPAIVAGLVERHATEPAKGTACHAI